jgi:Zn-dependent peptidase ImmA (M78 family)
MIRWKLIKETAARVLNQSRIATPPIDVEMLVREQGALVTRAPNKDESVSGFILRVPGSPAVIGVNSVHPQVRQRFTLAHELGHLLLHAGTELHVDRLVVKMRDKRASEGTDEAEIEANRFAAEILMPEEFLRGDLEGLGHVTADDEEAISWLAKRYGVSKQAMTIRLTSLNLIWM